MRKPGPRGTKPHILATRMAPTGNYLQGDMLHKIQHDEKQFIIQYLPNCIRRELGVPKGSDRYAKLMPHAVRLLEKSAFLCWPILQQTCLMSNPPCI